MPFLGGRGQASRGYFGGGTTPDAPTSLSSTAGDQQLFIAFTPPAFNGGLEITNYEYAVSSNGGSTYGSWTALSPSDTTSPVTIPGLVNGTAYYVKLRAVNSIGSGAESAALSTNTTPYTVPSIPTVTKTADTDTTVTWTWSSGGNGGNAITQWGHSLSTDNGSTWGAETVVMVGTTTFSKTIKSGSTYDTNRYLLRVRAYNAAEWGSYGQAATQSVPWVYETRNVVQEDTSCTDGSCSSTSSTSRSCGTCGSESGTVTGTRTRSRTRTNTEFQYTKVGYTASGWTLLTEGVYSSYTYTNWSYSTTWSGSCSEVGVGGAGWSDVTQNYAYIGLFTFAGLCWGASEFPQDAYDGSPGAGFYALWYPSCASGGPSYCVEGDVSYNVYRLYQCNATGAQWFLYVGCWTAPDT
jgi:hypothetical protein